MIELVPARLTHVGPLATNMREIDRLEARAMDRTPKDALRIGLRRSQSAFTAMDGGKPVAMMGVVPESLIESRGIVWMLGTDAVFHHGRDLLVIGPRVLAYWFRTFRVMENVVSTRNHAAIRLLRKWGAHVGGEIVAHRDVPFIPFKFDRPAIQGARPLP